MFTHAQGIVIMDSEEIAAAIKSQQITDEQVASQLRPMSNYQYGYKDGLMMAAMAIADGLERTVPGFDRETFLKAAGCIK
jgi:hypothetical protein